MDRLGPTGKVSKKLVHLLRGTTFPGRNFGWRDRAPRLQRFPAKMTLVHARALQSRTRSRIRVRIQRSLWVTQFKITGQLLWKCKSRLLKEVTGNETLEEIFINSKARIYRLMTVIITFTKYLSVRLRRRHANAGIVEKICLESLSI